MHGETVKFFKKKKEFLLIQPHIRSWSPLRSSWKKYSLGLFVFRHLLYNLQLHSDQAALFDMSAIQVRTWSFLRREKYLDLPEIETRFLRNPACSVVITPTSSSLRFRYILLLTFQHRNLVFKFQHTLYVKCE